MPGKNGGTLKRGGNNGGGRPLSVVRDACKRAFEDRIPLLEQIADGVMAGAEIGERIKAIDLLGKYGLGAVKEVSNDNVRERMQRTLDIIQEMTSAEQYTAIVRALHPVWSD